MSRGAVVWTPTEAAATQSGLARYMRWLADDRGRELAGYEDLWAWSVDDLEGFWESVWLYFDVHSPTPYRSVLSDRAMPGARTAVARTTAAKPSSRSQAHSPR